MMRYPKVLSTIRYRPVICYLICAFKYFDFKALIVKNFGLHMTDFNN